MTFHWSVLICMCVIFFFVGRASKPDVTIRSNRASEDTKPAPPIDRDWLAVCEPIIHKLEVGATIGTGVSTNREGAKALADLLSEMSNRLDYARHHGIKEDS